MGGLTRSWWFWNWQQSSRACWSGGGMSLWWLQQERSPISCEFFPSVIIAVKLQPITNNYDERWQVKCAHLQITQFIGERSKCEFLAVEQKSVFSSTHSGLIIRGFVTLHANNSSTASESHRPQGVVAAGGAVTNAVADKPFVCDSTGSLILQSKVSSSKPPLPDHFESFLNCPQ